MIMSAPTALQALLQAGQRLSNCCFNLGQEFTSGPIRDRDAKSMRDAAHEWDATLKAYREQQTVPDRFDTARLNCLSRIQRRADVLEIMAETAEGIDATRSPYAENTYGELAGMLRNEAASIRETDSAQQDQFAEADAALRGMAFLIDGVHVQAERVVIVSPPAGVGPIAEMRAAAAEAREALAQLKALQGVHVGSGS